MMAALEEKDKTVAAGAAKPSESQEKVKPYQVSFFDKIPFAVKALVIKYWFFGALYFFFVMGITAFMGDKYSVTLQMLLLSVVIGVANDFLVDNILLALETSHHEAHWWWMIKSKKLYSLFLNLAYGFVLGFGASLLCAYFASLLPSNDFGFFREPLSFAFVALALDLLLTGLKDGLVYLFRGKERNA